MNEILTLLLKRITKKTLDLSVEFFKNSYNKKSKENEDFFKNAYKQHFTKIINWSSRIQFYGMSKPHSIEQQSLELNISSEIKKYGDKEAAESFISENDILDNNENIILYGEPGAGKTTTLKRLMRKVIYDDSENYYENFWCPILIRFREIPEGVSLYTSIADAIGIEYKIEAEKKQDYVKTKVSIGENTIEKALPFFLNKCNALLIMDGFDELHPNSKSSFEAELSQLGLSLSSSKIIFSCRTGEINSQIEGFSYCELCRLNEAQIQNLSSFWIEDNKLFIEETKNKPYNELMDRPLFLSYLLLIYSKLKYLPERSIDVYKKVIYLLLFEWDFNRGINRKTKYSHFDPLRKIEFLSALSYHITYIVKQKSFTHDDLVSAYSKICLSFKLPENEAIDVIKEIESHSGIIVESFYNRFEFCHLVIQEYLCAEFIVNQPFADKVYTYLKEYPAPLAICIAISSDSGRWLATLILNSQNIDEDIINNNNIESLLIKVLSEEPHFAESMELGLAILYIYYKINSSSSSLNNILDGLIKIGAIEKSIRSALGWFSIKKESNNNFLILKRRFHFNTHYGITTPEIVSIPKDLLRHLEAKYQFLMVETEKT